MGSLSADYTSRVIILMSKVNIRFVYGGDHTVLVKERQKGPMDLNQGNEVVARVEQEVLHLQKTEGGKEGKEHQDLKSVVKEKEAVILNKAALTTYKSEETLPTLQAPSREANQKKKPVFEIHDVDEAQFHKNPEKPVAEEKRQQIIVKRPDQPKIVAPVFRSSSKNARKDYVRAENTEKYEYNNLPQKQEDEFMGCFGCMRRKPKTYSLQKKPK